MNINKKQAVASILLLVCNIALGFLWGNTSQYSLLAFVALFSGLSWVFFVLFAGDTIVYYIVSAVSVLLLAVGMRFDVWTALGIVCGTLTIVFAFVAGRNAYYSNIKFSPKIIAGKSLRIYFTAVAIVFSFAYFGIAKNTQNTSSLVLPEEVFSAGMRFLERPLQAIAPNITANSTLDDAIASFMQAQLKQAAGSNTSMVPSLSQIKKMIPQDRKEIIRTINKELGLNIDINTKGTEKLSTVLYRTSADKIDDTAKQFSSYVPWILSIGFFFSLKAISWVYYYIIILLSSVFIRVLLFAGIIQIEKVSVEKEILQ